MTSELFPTWTLGNLDLTSYPFGVEFGGDHGAPETISELVTSMLADGDLVRQTRHGNRSITITVVVEGPTLGGLAENEATLRGECAKRSNLLTFQPGDFDSPASVFEVLMVEMRQPRNDDHEQQGVRRWELTLTCAPFARSLSPSTTTALPAGITPSSSVIDTCAATTGWTQRPSGVAALLDAGSGAVYHPAPFAPVASMTLRRTGAVDFTTRRYLRIEWLPAGGSPLIAVAHDSSPPQGYRPVIVRPQAGGWLEATFDLEGVTSNKLDFIASYAPNRMGAFYIRHVESTNVPPAVTPRQTRRAISVGGTERTPGSLAIAANVPPSEVLGMAVVHTAPDGGSAFPLRSWRTAGNTQTPAANMSGYTEPLNTSAVFDSRVWASHVTPGNYLLAVRVTASATGTFRIPWTVETMDDATSQSYGIRSGNVAFQYSTIDTYQWVPLAIVALPTVRITDGHSIRVTLGGWVDNPSTPAFDEAWLFRGGDGCALTVVNNVEDYLWLKSADINDGTPTILAGNNADGSGARYPVGRVRTQGLHEFTPDITHAFVATESQYPLVSFEHYHRWHSNAADEGGEVE